MAKEEKLLACVELQTAEPVTSSIIWLHGLGADGHDFEALVPELKLPSELGGIRFIFPHAPIRPVTLNGQQPMRAWYDLASSDFSQPQDKDGILNSCRQIEQLIQRENQRGIPSQRIILAGFSQGGAIALQCGLHYSESLAGLMILSSYLPLTDDLANAHKSLPIFIAHGQQDPVIPIQIAQRSYQALQRHKIPMQWSEYPMPHSLCGDEIDHIRGWLIKTLGASMHENRKTTE